MTDFIEVYDDALDPSFCAELIRRFDASPAVTRGRTGHGVDLTKKNSYDLTLNTAPGWEATLGLLLERAFPPLRSYLRKYLYSIVGALSPMVHDPQAGGLVTLNEENFAALGDPVLNALVGRFYRYGFVNLQKYRRGEGGYPHWHSEIYPKDETCEPLHRVLAFQFYLNDVSEGGETEFYYQKRTITPKAGRLLVFPAGFTHTHRGNVPTSGDKYIVTSWILFQRAETVFRANPPAGP
jgi:hypothetical protein